MSVEGRNAVSEQRNSISSGWEGLHIFSVNRYRIYFFLKDRSRQRHLKKEGDDLKKTCPLVYEIWGTGLTTFNEQHAAVNLANLDYKRLKKSDIFFETSTSVTITVGFENLEDNKLRYY